MTDPLLDLVAGLPPAVVSATRAQATQRRCHRVLARRHANRTIRQGAPGRAQTGAVVGLAALYVAEAMRLLAAVYPLR